jgi:DNA-directed RNA polymerase subunit M/transcription elongation factor TFIIS
MIKYFNKMSNKNFCDLTFSLLEENTSGDKLKFISPKIGIEVESANADENTLLAEENTGSIRSNSKYKNTLNVTAYDPTNPKQIIPEGCPKCGRIIVSYQILGESKTMYCVCLCKHSWHN